MVFESDDWGAIRMPSRSAWELLISKGIRVDESRYDSLDCLETGSDFSSLMNLLASHRDEAGRPAKFTLNCVMGNPDFEAIEAAEFQDFFHQHFFDSYRQYSKEDLEPAWRDGIREALIRPQFHAREHLNSSLWMRDLRAGQPQTRAAFDARFYGLKTLTGSTRQKNYLAAYWPESRDELQEITSNVSEGLDLFRQTFGFRSNTFIGCNYVWPDALEKHLSELGVRLLQTQRGRTQPDPEQDGKTMVRRHYTGQKNQYGQHYSVRNVLFEPYLDDSFDWAERALGQIRQAFRFNRPAVVCSHRINYVSGMSLRHRDRSLAQLDTLIRTLRIKWPGVEFLTSDELAELMHIPA